MRKIFFLLFCLFSGSFANGQGIKFADEKFKQDLLAYRGPISEIVCTDKNRDFIILDKNENGEIEVDEALAVYHMSFHNFSCENIGGIEYFANLTTVNLYHTEVAIEKKLDFSSLPNLESISSPIGVSNDSRGIKELNLSNCPKLSSVALELVDLEVLNLKNCPALKRLEFRCYTSFPDIDFSQSILLEELKFDSFQISLDLTPFKELKSLELDLTGYDGTGLNSLLNLEKLELYRENNIKKFDLSNLSKLKYLRCTELPPLDFLDLSNKSELEVLEINFKDFNATNFKTIDLSGSKKLNVLYLLDIKVENLLIKTGSGISDYIFGGCEIDYLCADDSMIESLKSKFAYDDYMNGNLTSSVTINSYCSFVPGGEYFTAKGSNSLCGNKDVLIPNLKLLVDNGSKSDIFIADNTGNYNIPLQSGLYTITPLLEDPKFAVSDPASISLDLTKKENLINQNFCINLKNNNDLEINVTPIDVARPGFDSSYKIIYKNKGNQTQSGKVALSFNEDLLDYVSSNPAFTTTDPWKLIWDFKDLKPFETRTIDVTFNANSPMEKPAVNNGDVLKFTTNIQTTVTDETPNDNIFDFKQTVVGSYDPNDKTCLQGTVITPEMIGDYVHYKIRFENTGDYFAQNVVVEDDIDVTKFDLSSLVVLNSSHNMETRIENNQAKFIFENIKLPAKESPDRHGYVVFKIKTLPTLKLNDSFSNAAKIYFDFNFPIETIPATTTIKEATNLSNLDFDFSDKISLYPVPTKDVLNISASNTIQLSSVEIYNTMGQVVQAITNAKDLKSIDAQSLPKGTYFIKVNTNQGSSATTFIKE